MILYVVNGMNQLWGQRRVWPKYVGQWNVSCFCSVPSVSTYQSGSNKKQIHALVMNPNYVKPTRIICKRAQFYTQVRLLKGSDQSWPRLTRNSLGKKYIVLVLSIPSGNLTQLLKIAIDSEFPIKNCNFPQLCQSLPEGIPISDDLCVSPPSEFQC